MCIFLRKSVKQALVLSQSLQKAKEFIRAISMQLLHRKSLKACQPHIFERRL